jgi:putative redox protein
MKVVVRQIEGVAFVAKGESNHWVAIDGPKDFNGSEAASRPMELLLMAFGGCTGSDVASILSKKRVPMDHLDVIVTGDRAEEHPKVYTKIHVEYIFHGKDLNVTDLERAIALSQDKYCPLTAMLKDSCELSHSYRIAE